jgi:hypothetical protein
MRDVPDDLGWSEEASSHGHDLALRRPRAVSAVLLVVALGIVAWGVAHAVAIATVSEAIDEAYYPRSWGQPYSGPLASVPYVVGFVCLVVIWRAIGRLRDVPRMRVERSGFSLTGSLLLPRRVGFDIPLADITKFESLPAGFSTDVIPLGGGWDVVMIARSGERRRLRLPLDELAQAEFVANRLTHLVGSLRRGG